MTSVSDDRIERALHALLARDALALRVALTADPIVDAPWNGNTLLAWATQPPHDVDPAGSGTERLSRRLPAPR